MVELPISGDLDLAFVGRLHAVLRRTRPDLLHLHGRRGADVLGGFAGRLARLPVGMSVQEVCKRAAEHAGVMALPSTVYQYGDRHVRFGLGRKGFGAALEEYLGFLASR